MLIVPRRNYPMAVVRQAFQKRGKAYTTFGSMMRCVRPDQTRFARPTFFLLITSRPLLICCSITITVHYLNDGTSTLRFAIRKQEFFLPVVLVLKALVDTSDREIYEKIVQGDHDNTFVTERVELILKDAKQFDIYTRKQCRAYLGERFRVALALPASLSTEEVGNYLLRRFVFVHLNDDRHKFDVLMCGAKQTGLLLLLTRSQIDGSQALCTGARRDSRRQSRLADAPRGAPWRSPLWNAI